MPRSPDSDSLTNQGEPAWTLLSRDGLVDAYWDVIAPAMRADDLDPETKQPTYEWLNDNGFRRFIYTLQEHHNATVTEFCKHDLGLESQGYEWDIEHADTVEALERYLDRQQQRKSWRESTVDAHRSRLARYVRAYARVNDTDDLLSPVARDADVPAHDAVDACWATFDALDQAVARETLRRIYITVSDWYTTLVSRREAALNPTDGLDYNWSSDSGTTSNPPLDPDHVAALFDAASDTREKLLVVALCGWGLRSGEVAALHVDQLVLDEAAPRIQFESRKNGPGSVALIYGQDIVEDRLALLADDGGWNGYLFPSPRSKSGHRTGGTIRNWFDALADQAALPETIDGHRPVPQMARRFWYDRYSSTVEELVEHQIQEVAEEQGSVSASVVWDDYLSEDRRRELRREFMQTKLAAAFSNTVEKANTTDSS